MRAGPRRSFPRLGAVPYKPSGWVLARSCVLIYQAAIILSSDSYCNFTFDSLHSISPGGSKKVCTHDYTWGGDAQSHGLLTACRLNIAGSSSLHSELPVGTVHSSMPQASEGELCQAVLDFVTEGTYPEEKVVAAKFPATALAKELELISKAREEVEVSTHREFQPSCKDIHLDQPILSIERNQLPQPRKHLRRRRLDCPSKAAACRH